jgi:uncharacterized protein (DUF2147 family)
MLTLIASVLLLGAATAASAQNTPSGQWRTISDVDGKPRALIDIREVNGRYIGVVRASLVPGEVVRACDKCVGERKGQPIIGMEILRGLRAEGNEWGGGEILDPDTGKTYRAKMRLEADGNRLVVRGYVGISLIGRSQKWERVP